MGIFDLARNLALADGKGERQTIALNTIKLKGGVPLGDLVNDLRQAFDDLKNPLNITPNPLLMGLNMRQYRELYHQAKMNYAKKQFFKIRFIELSIPEDTIDEMDDKIFQFLAIDVSYSDTMTGDSQKVGAFMLDQFTGKERKEIRVTFYDRHDGILTRYIDGKIKQMVHDDGTVGLPSQYIVGLIVQRFDQEDGTKWPKKLYKVRFNSMDTELSRRDLGAQEIPITFTEVDEFL